MKYERQKSTMQLVAGSTIRVLSKGKWTTRRLYYPRVYGVLHVKQDHYFEEVLSRGILSSKHSWCEIHLAEGFQLYESTGCMCVRDVAACAAQRVLA